MVSETPRSNNNENTEENENRRRETLRLIEVEESWTLSIVDITTQLRCPPSYDEDEFFHRITNNISLPPNIAMEILRRARIMWAAAAERRGCIASNLAQSTITFIDILYGRQNEFWREYLNRE
jgi:hypothetical protein